MSLRKIVDSTIFVHYNTKQTVRISYKKKGGDYMNRTSYLLTARDVKEILGCSLDHAYKVIKKMNTELKERGYEVETGKVPKKFFAEKFYGLDLN